MAHIYIKPAFNDNLTMVKVSVNGKEQWANCSAEVKQFAKANLKEKDEVEFPYEEKDGKITITGYITKPGQEAPSAQSQQAYSPPAGCGFVCEDCGTTLKDGKYKRCYTCNQKAKENGTEPATTSYKGKNSSTVNESIKRQAIGHMTSRALMALQGQVSEENINKIVESLYNKFQELVG